MSFVRKLFERAGLVTVDVPVSPTAAGTATPAPLQRRSVSMAELLAEAQRAGAHAAPHLSAPAARFAVDVSEVLAQAALTVPPHGWTADRAAELLAGEALVQSDREARRQGLSAALAAAEAPAEDLLRDAGARDRAIDVYAEILGRKVREERARLADAAEAAEGRRRAAEAELERLSAERRAVDAAYRAFVRAKRLRERAWAEVVALLADDAQMDAAVVSVTSEE